MLTYPATKPRYTPMPRPTYNLRYWLAALHAAVRRGDWQAVEEADEQLAKAEAMLAEQVA